MRTVVIVLILAICFAACDKGKLPPTDYIRYVNDKENGLRVIYPGKDIEYTVQYRPTEYIAANELRSEELNEGDMNRVKKELGGLQYYTLSLTPSNSTTGIELFARTENGEVNPKYEYWAYGMQHDIYLIEGMDTLYPALFHYEDTYGVKPSSDWSIAFEKRDTNMAHADKIFVINDQISGKGSIKLKITKEAINSIPSIITE